MSQLTVAVFGTGIMGSAMARNIVGAGHAVRVQNRTVLHAQPLADNGIEAALTTTATVEGADIVITMFFDSATVVEVMCETAPAMHPGATWSQMTTVGPGDVAGLVAITESVGVLFYDLPASGARQPAESGTLVIIIASPASGRELVTPVLDAVGSRTVWTGEDGIAATSTRLKLVVNSWVTAVPSAAGEIATPAKAIGVSPAQFFEVLDGDGLDLPLLRIKADLVERGVLSPANFTVDTPGKDVRLILELARGVGLRLDDMEAFSAWLDRVAEAGHAHEDMAAPYLTELSTSTKTS